MKKSTIVKNTLKTATRQHKRAIALFAVAMLAAVYTAPVAIAATLTSASLALSDPRPGLTNVTYTFTGSNVSTGGANTLRCIKFVFSTTVAGSTVPTDMNTSAAALDAASTYVPTPASWTTNGSSQNGTVTMTNATGEVPGGASARTIILNGITNSTVTDTTFFAKINTYGNQDCSSTPIDNSTIAFIITNGQAVTMTVDPTLTFSVAGTAAGAACNNSASSTVDTTATTVPLGSLTATTNSIGVQDLTVSTNAGTGYTVAARYTGKPTFGTNDIDDHTGTNGAPTVFSGAGTEAYGYTTDDDSLGTGTADRFTSAGGNKWAAFTTTNAEIAYSANGVTSEPTCIAHQAGVAALTAAGSYATSAIYTATPIY